MRLRSGDRVVIVGGGPAGSFAALHLLRLAAARGLRLDVRLYEPRDFSKPGPQGCNMCAGIVSSRVVRGLHRLKIEVPLDVVQARIRTYVLHLPDAEIAITQPDPTRKILSVYRGGGPRKMDEPLPSFDAFLFRLALAEGAVHVPERVRAIRRGGDGRPQVITQAGDCLDADFLILATGVNGRQPEMDPAFGYRPPRRARMMQREVLRPGELSRDAVHVWFSRLPWVKFGAFIPKGRFADLSLMGRDMPSDGIDRFLQDVGAQAPENFCQCAPYISLGRARRVCGERWVAVGDAAVTRLYKDGIGSAFYTAQAAMRAAVMHGISARALWLGYGTYAWRIWYDNLYGYLLFWLWAVTLRTPWLLRAWVQVVQFEQAQGRFPLHKRVLWGMFTADEPYQRLFWLTLHPTALRRLLRFLFARERNA